MTAFKDFRDPIEYVVTQYFQRQKNYASNKPEKSGQERINCDGWDKGALPDYPFKMLKNRDGKAYKFIYGNLKALQQNPEADVVIWQEEIIYDENGKFSAIKTTYPNGYEVIASKEEMDGEFTGFGLE